MPSVQLGPVLLLIASALGAGCQRGTSRGVMVAGRGGLRDTGSVQIISVATAAYTNDFKGRPVAADPGSMYVVLDCQIAAPPNQVDVSDFQLVQSLVADIGAQANLGNHEDTDYFYWSYLDAAGRPVATVPVTAGSFALRLAFKVSAGSREGYLFYWGLYWGPVTFPAAPY